MGLRKKLAVVAFVVVLGAGSVSANMPVIDISSIMTSIQQFVTEMSHMKQEVMKWTNEAKKALKAAQAITKGDFRSFVQGMQQMNALVAKYANISDGWRDIMADEDATGDVLLKVYSKFEERGFDGFVDDIREWSDGMEQRWSGITQDIGKAWNETRSVSDFFGALDTTLDFAPACAGDAYDMLASMSEGMSDFIEVVLNQQNAAARFSNRNISSEEIDGMTKRIGELREAVARLTEEIGVALSNGAATEVAQKREQREQKLQEIGELESIVESHKAFSRGLKEKNRKNADAARDEIDDNEDEKKKKEEGLAALGAALDSGNEALAMPDHGVLPVIPPSVAPRTREDAASAGKQTKESVKMTYQVFDLSKLKQP